MEKQTLILIAVVSLVNGISLDEVPAKMSRYTTELPVIGDYKLFEGDIKVSKYFSPTKRNAVANEGFLWPKGAIPYSISRRFNSTSKRLFKTAMKKIESLTKKGGRKCIQFVPRRKQADYVYIENYRSCSSAVGRQGGRQEISLGAQCNSVGTVMHELLHTLGFYHEQSRADRDNYVNIHTENMIPGMEENFQKYAIGAEILHLNQPYDYDSIMHYPTDSFSRNSKPTITPKLKGAKIGQRNHLSEIDVKMIQSLYECDGDEQEQSTKSPGSECKDNMSNCYLYGASACKDLPNWAAKNCALTCGICKKACEDKIDNCASYIKEMCTLPKYRQFAESNCAKHCGLGSCKVEMPAVTEEVCKDELPNCADYNKAYCTYEEYKPWANANCERYCGFCTSPVSEQKPSKVPVHSTTTPATTPPLTIVLQDKTCEDELDYCYLYRKSYCESSDYKSFMAKRCAKFCGFCKPSGDPLNKKPTTTTTKITTTVTTKRARTCKDKLDSCSNFGKSYCSNMGAIFKEFMVKNCSKYCDFC